MLYAILAYHVEDVITALTPEEDAALMTELLGVHHRMIDDGQMGPSARLGPTRAACTLRGPGRGVVLDGPFAETKEHLLGFYVVDAPDREGAVELARRLRGVNPSAVYEIRPIPLYIPGAGFPVTEAAG